MHIQPILMLALVLPILIAVITATVYLLILLCKALRKYIGSKPVRAETADVQKALGEVLREQRIRCKMTQEFVAEHLGVSRQAVSKWENGTSEPHMSNLMELAKLYGIPVEEILRQASSQPS